MRRPICRTTRAWIWNLCRCLSALLLSAALAFAQGSSVTLEHGEFRLADWHGGAAPAFAVYAGPATTPMLGTYAIEGGTLVFRPRFPLEPGIRYRVVYPGGALEIDAPSKPAPATRIEQVYPSTNVLPANTLRLYIRFSAPMSAGNAFQHIRLLEDGGRIVPGAFLDQELWDPQHTRLTVLFDPGRIKRGLVPARQLGTPIVEGRHYRLEIDSGWRDANGASLLRDFEKTFTGGAADRTRADPKSWRIAAPKAGTMQPLIVDFPRAMDFALLHRMLTVDGVRGTIAVGNHETRWSFTPDTPWRARRYVLDADAALEDVCGNRLDRPFDVDLRRAAPIVRGGRFRLPFHPVGE